MKRLFSAICASALMALGAVSLQAQDKQIVKDGERIEIIGDSITAQQIYSRYMEAYIRACSGLKDVKVFQFGWSGERAPGFAARMEHDAYPWKPTLITICFGMNDGGYRKYDPATIGATYSKGMDTIVKGFKSIGAKALVGTPGVVDSDTYRRNPDAVVYNENLAELAKVAQTVASDNSEYYVNLNAIMMDAMKKAKAQLGEKYHVAGSDGVHPAPNGQLVMAYAFLKGMGFDGNIATVDMDFKGKTTVSAGHEVKEQSTDTVTIESTRYPFCFRETFKADDPAAPESMLPYIPFQQDLNRFTLKIKNLPSEKADVTWGKNTKEFSKADLEKGVNLADAFRVNPFSAQFDKLMASIAQKQSFEGNMIVSVFNSFRHMSNIFKGDKNEAEIKNHIEAMKPLLFEKQASLDDAVKNNIIPVTHTIKVTPK